MNSLRTYVKILSFAVICTVLFFAGTLAVHAENIDPDNDDSQYAQLRSDDSQINFEPNSGGVTISDSGTNGNAWGENTGWINTNPGGGDVDLVCSGDTGTFAGYWWGQNAGWINLAPTNAGLTLTAGGELDGDIWSQNFGWIKFDCGSADSCVKTDFVCQEDTNTTTNTGSKTAQCDLDTNASVVTPGEPITLSWSTNILDGQYTDAIINPLGTVDPEDGYIVAYISKTTTFNATFEGNFVSGSATCSVTVEVDEGEIPPEPPVFIDGCTDEKAENYNPDATNNDGLCTYNPDEVYGCLDIEARNYNPDATVTNNSCAYSPVEPPNPPEPPVTATYGCIDPDASNYNTDATDDDGTCRYVYGESNETDIDIEPGQLRLAETRHRINVNNTESFAISILRTSGNDGVRTATLRFIDGTAMRGTHYETLAEYQLRWKDGEDDSRRIIVQLTDIDYDTRTKNFTIELLGEDGVVIERYNEAQVTLIQSGGKPINIPLITSIASLIALATSAATLPFRIQNILLAIPGYRRRHRPWGTVYDAKTKQPLDPAYVQLFNEQGEEVASSITDLDGRYGFLVEPGTYYLKAGKTNYTFPSNKLQGQHKDNLYTNLYFGEQVFVDSEGQVIKKDIPMDATGDDWNEEAKRSMNVAQFFSRHDGIAHRIIDALFIIGLGLSIYSAIAQPVWYNIAILAVYAVFIIITLIGLSVRSYGKITSTSGEPLAGALIRVYNAHLNKEIAHKIVGENGRYYMLVQKGEYYLTVEVPTGPDEYKHIHTSDSFKVSNGIIKKDIQV